jgi:hypothetical protein
MKIENAWGSSRARARVCVCVDYKPAVYCLLLCTLYDLWRSAENSFCANTRNTVVSVWTTRPCFSRNIFPLHLSLIWMSWCCSFLIGPVLYPCDRDQKSSVISFIRQFILEIFWSTTPTWNKFPGGFVQCNTKNITCYEQCICSVTGLGRKWFCNACAKRETIREVFQTPGYLILFYLFPNPPPIFLQLQQCSLFHCFIMQ